MLRYFFCCAVFLSLYTSYVAGTKEDFYQKCEENITKTLSCSTPLSEPDDDPEANVCKVVVSKPLNNSECRAMTFGPFQSDKPFNSGIGGVSLRPYILDNHGRSYNYTVLNITFTNIKWKTMKFRFHNPQRPSSCHSRQLARRGAADADGRSVLYYDCYWAAVDGDHGAQHYLDFEAQGDSGASRGQYFFNIPTVQMLSTTVSENEWKPFLYIEILSHALRLHITPPPPQLALAGYHVEVRRGCARGEHACSERLLRAARLAAPRAEEATLDYCFVRSAGALYFVVTPLHARCGADRLCRPVQSPKIDITTDEHKTLNICIVSVFALVVAALFAYYLALRYLRRCCGGRHRGHAIPPPTTVLVIYPSGSRVHAECVGSLAACLRAECGLDVLLDADVAATPHGDPLRWARQAAARASHVLYVAGPAGAGRGGAHALRDVDLLLLSMLRAARSSKRISNVRFDHSDGELPVETKRYKTFYLLKDWNKMVAYLSEDSIPTAQLSRTDKGKCLIDDLERAKKLLSGNVEDVIVGYEKNAFEKKILV